MVCGWGIGWRWEAGKLGWGCCWVNCEEVVVGPGTRVIFSEGFEGACMEVSGRCSVGPVTIHNDRSWISLCIAELSHYGLDLSPFISLTALSSRSKQFERVLSARSVLHRCNCSTD